MTDPSTIPYAGGAGSDATTVARLADVLELLIAELRGLGLWPAEGSPRDTSGAHATADELLDIARAMLQEARLGQKASRVPREPGLRAKRREEKPPPEPPQDDLDDLPEWARRMAERRVEK